MLSARVNEYAVIARVNVPWLEEAIKWYENTLDLKNDERFYVEDTWAQLYCPGLKGFAVGLSQGTPTPGAGTVTTFVVNSIEDACEDLKEKGVVVGPITDAGKGVQLASFYDPFGNNMTLRENSKDQPKPSEIGS